MAFDKIKLAKMLCNTAIPANEHMLDPALKVLQTLDAIPEDSDFDITAIENAAGGPYISTESARIAKLVNACHSRGQQWVEKWNQRVTETTAEAEAARNDQILNGRAGIAIPPEPPTVDDPAMISAQAKIDEALAKIQG